MSVVMSGNHFSASSSQAAFIGPYSAMLAIRLARVSAMMSGPV